ncbi:MAG TPA: hypothetical protein DEP42_06725 [Ruminococcaceae bacterium]|nr:hypothetical protein [Oscillospiraceae bacterium]
MRRFHEIFIENRKIILKYGGFFEFGIENQEQNGYNKTCSFIIGVVSAFCSLRRRKPVKNIFYRYEIISSNDDGHYFT